MSGVCNMGDKKRIQVAFTEGQWNLIEKLRGEMGNTDADIVRNIVISWLSEKSFISDTVKNKPIFYNNDSQEGS